MKHILLTIMIIVFYGCSSKDDYILFNQVEKSQNNQILKPLNIEFEYRILPHDRISLIVYKHPELSTTSIENMQEEKGLLVNSKGFLRLPLIHKIKISGLTQTEAEEKISNAYRTYLKHPDVQLEVLNKRAYVIGEVRRAGEIELKNERLSLLQVLALAGDLTDGANRKSILVFKSGDTKKVRASVVDLTNSKSLITANLMIEPNDIVYVMPNDMKVFNNKISEIAPIFNLIGSVLNPFLTLKILSDQ
ncbi:MAG: Polysaccharide export outer membrane protein [uncultured Sulfurovum sp.]|uniref:Polysaccharide export outer membrane protein n=1 Tax=uncultured Sulfurovum sp. TaxID=269237 RepID=A0A6S6U6P4_9BACT|nr:MAG: Polysaccharide export outer membrane protein [uncultured Sulfurovum sp.]